MTRRCSHCGNNGHNSRTCPNRGVKIFGVRLDGGGSIRKSASMGNLSHYPGASGGASPAAGDGVDEREKDGYASEDFVKGSSSSCRERKKGVAWTEEEHKMFLLGLQKLGKGDWRGISRKFVVSRTATQVASHAQKYFIRQTNANRRKRRSSLFDMVPDELSDAQAFPVCDQEPEAHSNNSVPAPPLEEHESMNSNSANPVPAPPPPSPPVNVQPFPVDMERAFPKPVAMQYPYAVICPPYPPFFPFSYPFWPYYRTDAMVNKAPSIAKPTAVHSTTPINVDELGGMSTLNLGEAVGGTSNSVAPNLLGGSERHSAFHTNNPPPKRLGGSERHSAFHTNNPPTSGSRINLSSSPIHAV